MNGRSLLQLFGLAAPPAPELRPYRPQSPGPPAGRSFPFGPIVTAAEYGSDFELWQANKLTITVRDNAVAVQLSRTQPPDPPEWDAPFIVDVGPYSHVGSFGYFRFKDATAGAHATVQGTAFSE